MQYLVIYSMPSYSENYLPDKKTMVLFIPFIYNNFAPRGYYHGLIFLTDPGLNPVPRMIMLNINWHY